jgi:multidrug efflux pump
VVAFTGFDFIGGGFKNNAATIFVTQKHWDERRCRQQLVGELFGKTAGIKEALVLAFNPPPIFGLGNGRRLRVLSPEPRRRRHEARWPRVMGAVPGALAKTRSWPVCRHCGAPNAPQLRVDVDRERAKALGVPLNELFNTLAGHAGHLLCERLQQVRPRVAGADVGRKPVPQAPEDIGRMYVRTAGEMVPVSAFAKVEYSSGPDTLNRFNNLPP